MSNLDVAVPEAGGSCLQHNMHSRLDQPIHQGLNSLWRGLTNFGDALHAFVYGYSHPRDVASSWASFQSKRSQHANRPGRIFASIVAKSEALIFGELRSGHPVAKTAKVNGTITVFLNPAITEGAPALEIHPQRQRWGRR